MNGYVGAVRFIEFAPWNVPLVGWALLACGIVVAVRYRRDPSLLAMTLLPQSLAIAGYSLFLASLDHYYYLSVMPAAAMTLVARRLGDDAAARGDGSRRRSCCLESSRWCRRSCGCPRPCTGCRSTVCSWTRHGESRSIGQPMRSIRTEFALPPTTDPEYLFKVLGGRIDRESPWTSVITADGDVKYVQVK